MSNPSVKIFVTDKETGERRERRRFEETNTMRTTNELQKKKKKKNKIIMGSRETIKVGRRRG